MENFSSMYDDLRSVLLEELLTRGLGSTCELNYMAVQKKMQMLSLRRKGTETVYH